MPLYFRFLGVVWSLVSIGINPYIDISSIFYCFYDGKKDTWILFYLFAQNSKISSILI